MYIVITSFSKSPEVVAEYFKEHCAWLNKYNKEGVFLASGPKKSNLGGAILVCSMDENQLKAILAEDSYAKADVADYQIIDMDFKLTIPGLEQLLENKPSSCS